MKVTRVTQVARTRPTRDRGTAFAGATAPAALQSTAGRAGENSERGKLFKQEAGSGTAGPRAA